MEFLGSGGNADVYRARLEEPSMLEEAGREEPDREEAVLEEQEREVALKILREPERSAAAVRRFIREGYLLQRLEGPGLPRCYHVVEQPHPALVLELLRGNSLADALARKGPLSADRVFRIAQEILRVLAFLHQQGVVHRDVKSSNIYLCDDGRALLFDLGLAMDPEDPFTTTLGDVMGTYAYMAPEQIAGAEVDLRSDLYSLGITLYEALCGERPYSARGTAGYLRAHRSGGARSLGERVEGAPARLVNFIHRLMARDPSARPPSAGIALALLSGRSSAYNELKPPPLLGRWSARGATEAVIDGGGVVQLVGEVGSGTGRVARMALDLARDYAVEALALRCRAWGVQRRLFYQLANGLSLLMGLEVAETEEEVLDALKQLEGEGPFLLLLEDIHLEEPQELVRMARVLAQVEGLSVVTTALFPVNQLPGREVALRPLRREEVAALISGMLGTPYPPGDMVGLLLRATGGLPALVVLAVREFHARGALRCEGLGEDGESHWTLDPGANMLRSFGLEQVFQRMLTEMPSAARAALDCLALAGEPLPMSVLIRAAGLDPSGIDVLHLTRLGLVSRSRDAAADWIAVRRPAVGALVMQSLPEARRMPTHLALAQALRAYDPGPWRDEAMALHSVLGGEQQDVAPALLALGQGSLSEGELARTRKILRHINDFAPDDPGMNAHVALLRGEELLASEKLKEAREALLAARELARELDDAELIGRAAVGLAAVQLQTGSGMRCEALAIEAERICAEAGSEARLQARVLCLRGYCSMLRGAEKTAHTRFQRAAREAVVLGESDILAVVRCGTAALHAERARHEPAVRYLQSEIERLEARPARRELCLALQQLAEIRCWEGLFDKALRLLERAERLAHHLELPYLGARVGVKRAIVLLTGGDQAGAVRLLRRHSAAREARSDVFTRLDFHLASGEVRFATGDRQAALAAFDQATDAARKLGFAAAAAFSEGMTGVLTASANPLEEGLDVLEKVGAKRRMAVLLLAGAQIVGDAAAVTAAVRVARDARDKPLLLRALHMLGGERAWAEAVVIAMDILDGAGPQLKPFVEALPAVVWAMKSKR